MVQVQMIKDLVAPLLTQDDIQLYDVSWQMEGQHHILQIAIMHKDGSMDIDTCAAMSEKLSVALDEADIIADEYFLEVCSPGAERELKDDAQLKGAVDEYVYVKLENPKQGMSDVKGYLKEVSEDVILIEFMDKAVKKKATIERNNIALIRLSVKI